jgi:putative transposon-encoded protein
MARPPKYRELKKLKLVQNISIKKDSRIRSSKDKAIRIFETKVSRNSSGAYISTSQDFTGHRAYVIIMEDKVNG